MAQSIIQEAILLEEKERQERVDKVWVTLTDEGFEYLDSEFF